MKTKPQKIWTATIVIGLLCMGLAACSTAPQATTPRYQLSADAAWSSHILAEGTRFAESRLGFGYATVTADTFRVNFVDQAGEVRHTAVVAR